MRITVDRRTLRLNGFEYPKDTNTGEPVYNVIPPLKMKRQSIRNIETESINSPPERILTPNGAKIYTETIIPNVANIIIRKHLFTKFRSFVFAI